MPSFKTVVDIVFYIKGGSKFLPKTFRLKLCKAVSTFYQYISVLMYDIMAVSLPRAS